MSNYQNHIKILPDDLIIHLPTFEEQVIRLKNLLKFEKTTSRDIVKNLIELFEGKNINYQVNPNVYIDVPYEIDKEEKARHIENAIQKYLESKRKVNFE